MWYNNLYVLLIISSIFERSITSVNKTWYFLQNKAAEQCVCEIMLVTQNNTKNGPKHPGIIICNKQLQKPFVISGAPDITNCFFFLLSLFNLAEKQLAVHTIQT